MNQPMPHGLQDLINLLERVTREPVETQDGYLSFTVSHRQSQRFNFNPVPKDWSLRIKLEEGGSIRIDRTEPLAMIEATITSDATLQLNGFDVESVQIHGSEGTPRLALSGERVRYLGVERAAIEAKASVGELRLDSASLLGTREAIKSVTIGGNVTFARTLREFDRIELFGDCVLALGGDCLVRELTWKGDGPSPELHVTGAVLTIPSCKDGCRLRIETGIAFTNESFEKLRISGGGGVQIRGASLASCEFAPEVGKGISVHIRDGLLASTTGTISVLQLESGQTFTGGEPPARLLHLSNVRGGNLLNVDIYDLPLGDLELLREARMVVPWIPPRRQSRPREDQAQPASSSDVHVEQQARAQFWSLLGEILATKHAPGAVRSDVRYAAHRTRRISLRRGREKGLLFAYMPLGYGERILNPLIALALISVVTTLVIVGNEGNLWHTLASVVISPLAFFRFVEPPSTSGTVDTIALLFVRVVGLFLIVLSLFAARKVARAE